MKKDSESMKHSDHTIFLNGFILKAAAENKEIKLFSPHTSRGLYDCFYSDSSNHDFHNAYARAVTNGSRTARRSGRRQGPGCSEIGRAHV